MKGCDARTKIATAKPAVPNLRCSYLGIDSQSAVAALTEQRSQWDLLSCTEVARATCQVAHCDCNIQSHQSEHGIAVFISVFQKGTCVLQRRAKILRCKSSTWSLHTTLEPGAFHCRSRTTAGCIHFHSQHRLVAAPCVKGKTLQKCLVDCKMLFMGKKQRSRRLHSSGEPQAEAVEPAPGRSLTTMARTGLLVRAFIAAHTLPCDASFDGTRSSAFQQCALHVRSLISLMPGIITCRLWAGSFWSAISWVPLGSPSQDFQAAHHRPQQPAPRQTQSCTATTLWTRTHTTLMPSHKAWITTRSMARTCSGSLQVRLNFLFSPIHCRRSCITLQYYVAKQALISVWFSVRIHKCVAPDVLVLPLEAEFTVEPPAIPPGMLTH